MLKTKNLFFVAFILLITQMSYRCHAMDDVEELRREVLDNNAHKILFEKMNIIISNHCQNVWMALLSKDEHYILLKRFFERSPEAPPLSVPKQLFFEKLQKLVAPDILLRARPPRPPLEPIEEEPFEGAIPIP